MFSVALIAVASLVASVSGRAVPRVLARDDSSVPSTYAQGYLEDYQTYHTRYLALDCEDQHGTPFFDACCHPMLATETLEANRAPECNPANNPAPSSSSSDPAPAPSSSSDPAPTSSDSSDAGVANVAAAPTSDAAPAPPAPSSSSAPAPSPAPASSNSGGLGNIVSQLFTGGIATFFFQNGVAGACGTVHGDNDNIVALPTAQYANGANCGRNIVIKDATTGKTANAVVADECPTCDNDNCLDLSHGLFNTFAQDGQGTFDLQWAYTS